MKSLKPKTADRSSFAVTTRNAEKYGEESYHIFRSILCSLMTDVTRLRPGTKGLERDLVTLEARIEHEGIAFLGTSLCTLGDALDRGLSTGTFRCPAGFKTQKGSKIPRLFGGIFSDVFDQYTGQLKERDCTEDVKILRQLLFFLQEACTEYCSIRKDGTVDDACFLADRFRSRRQLYFYSHLATFESYQPCFPTFAKYS